jgi:MFS family permease
MIAMPISSNYVASLAPDDMRGRYMGVLGFSWNTAVGVGPTVGLFIFGCSPELLSTLCSITGVVAASPILVKARFARIQEKLIPLRADH